MAKSLSDIVGLVASGDANILEEQEKSNTTLESIDRNLKDFLANQKNSRLDNLEDRREKKRGSMAGLPSAAVVGGGLTAGIAATTGDSINPLTAILGYQALKTALGLAGKSLRFMARTLSTTYSKSANVVRGVTAQLDELRAKLIKDIDDFEKAVKNAQDKVNRAKKLRRLATADVSRLRAAAIDEANDPRSKTNQEKLRKAEVAESRRIAIEDARKVALEKMQRAKANVKTNLDAVEEAKNKSGAERSKKLRQIQADIKAGELQFKQQQDLARRIAQGVDRTNDPRSRANTDIAQQDQVKATRIRVGSEEAKLRLAAEASDRINDPRSMQNQDSARLATAAADAERVRLNKDLTARGNARNLMGQADTQFKGLINQREVDAFKRAGLRSNLLANSGAMAAEKSGGFIKNVEMKNRLAAAGLTETEIKNLETQRTNPERLNTDPQKFANLANDYGEPGRTTGGGSRLASQSLDKGGLGLGLLTGQVDAYAEAGLRGAGFVGQKVATNSALKTAAGMATKAGLAIGSIPFQALLLTLYPTTMGDGTIGGAMSRIAKDVMTIMVQGGPKQIRTIMKLITEMRTYANGDYEDLLSLSDEDILNLTTYMHMQHNNLMMADTEAGEMYRETGQVIKVDKITGEESKVQAIGTVPQSLRNKLSFGNFGPDSAKMSARAYDDVLEMVNRVDPHRNNYTPANGTANGATVINNNTNVSNTGVSGNNSNSSGIKSIDLNANRIPGFAQ